MEIAPRRVETDEIVFGAVPAEQSQPAQRKTDTLTRWSSSAARQRRLFLSRHHGRGIRPRYTNHAVHNHAVGQCRPHLAVSTAASPWQSMTVTVRAGWRRVPVGSMPGTGSRKVMHRPRAPLVAMVSPRSAREKCAGPAVLRKLNGPVTVVDVTLARVVRTLQSPNRTASSPSRTWTAAVAGVMPKGRPASR
jgi:hypothetical protein